jgi:SAM-dependent methyltransferase
MWQQRYLERFYPQTSWRRDGTRDFFDLLRKYCRGKILEVGAGPGNPTSDYLKTLGEPHGVDIDPEIFDNTALKTAAVIEDRFPFPDCTFDACVSDYVCEHVENPYCHLEEVWRVLKPGGAYVFRTPNRFHYTAIVSHLTPHSFHVKVANRLRSIDGHDPYPTCYRLNSRRKIRRLSRDCGFQIEYMRMVEKEPSYGMSSRLLFLTFAVYERLVNSSVLFSDLRANLFVVLLKPQPTL